MPEYKGHTYEVKRVEDYHDREYMPHEFFAVVDGKNIVSATELEREHNVSFEDIPSWEWVLTLCARMYIDGNDAPLEVGHSVSAEDVSGDVNESLGFPRDSGRPS